MKVNFTRLATLALAIGVNYSAFCQNWLTNGNNVTAGQFLGSINNQPLLFRTANVTRMRINPNTGATSGFVGINTNNPAFMLSVRGEGVATSQGWTRGLLLENDGAIMWRGNPSSGGTPGTPWNFFMAHASNNPVGDFYEGKSFGIGSNAIVDYTRKVFASSAPASGVIGSTQIFKDLYIT